MYKHYNYDLDEANWLIRNGCKDLLSGVGINPKTNNTYVCFNVSKKYKEAQKYYNTNIRTTQSLDNQCKSL